jgi:LPXTG-motif cell wall-anchored protein
MTRGPVLRSAAAASVLVATAALATAACSDDKPAQVPYTDGRSVGMIALYDKDGKAVTSGKISDKPFVAKAVSQARAPQPYDHEGRKATLLAFLPRKDADPTQWHGKFLTGASAYPDAAHPTVISPAEAGSLAEFLETYPTQWDGLVQLRIYLGVPGEATLTTSYATADIRVHDGTWTVVRGATGTAAGRHAGSMVAAAVVDAAVMDGETGVPIEVRVGGTENPTPTPTGGDGGPLPRTGTDVITLVGAGLALIAAGAVAILIGRRRRAATIGRGEPSE